MMMTNTFANFAVATEKQLSMTKIGRYGYVMTMTEEKVTNQGIAACFANLVMDAMEVVK